MKKTYNKFLIISTTFLLIGGVYLYFSNDLNSKTIVPIAYGSSLASSTEGDVSTITTATSASEKISSDIAFLSALTSLNRIKIDTSLFENKFFMELKDNSIKIEPVTPGRINPFAPIESNVSNVTIVTDEIITNQSIQGIISNTTN